ncbi:unnamed protein product [Heligmosomoides polygyrus]|uniref:Peroxisomal membrane protein PMP34 n=1 Tax=Heligmosomoides polygyrus TaxID=6339 RepID=A0A183GP55_HELPZ|nr:unnamed protein product [Heligmosomoides polygyrus]
MLCHDITTLLGRTQHSHSFDQLENYGMPTTGALLSLQLVALSRRSSDGKPPEAAIHAATKLAIAYGVINLARFVRKLRSNSHRHKVSLFQVISVLSKGVVLLPSGLMTLYCLTPGGVYNRKDPEGLVNHAKDLVKVSAYVIWV